MGELIREQSPHSTLVTGFNPGNLPKQPGSSISPVQCGQEAPRDSKTEGYCAAVVEQATPEWFAILRDAERYRILRVFLAVGNRDLITVLEIHPA